MTAVSQPLPPGVINGVLGSLPIASFPSPPLPEFLLRWYRQLLWLLGSYHVLPAFSPVKALPGPVPCPLPPSPTHRPPRLLTASLLPHLTGVSALLNCPQLSHLHSCVLAVPSTAVASPHPPRPLWPSRQFIFSVGSSARPLATPCGGWGCSQRLGLQPLVDLPALSTEL